MSTGFGASTSVNHLQSIATFLDAFSATQPDFVLNPAGSIQALSLQTKQADTGTPGSAAIQGGYGASLAGGTSAWIRTLYWSITGKVVAQGAADSGGVGFRQLIVPNT